MEHTKEQREKILEAASDLFIAKGIMITLEEIAIRSRTSVAQVRDLFENTTKLFTEIFQRNWARLNTVVQEVQINPALSPKAKLLRLYRQIVEGIRNAAPFGTTFLLQGRQGDDLGKQFVKTGLITFAKQVDAIILEGQQEGLFRTDLPVETLRQQLIGCGESILLGWMWQGRAGYPAPYSLDDACRVFEAILDGLIISSSPVPAYDQARVNTAPGRRDKGTGEGGKTMDRSPRWRSSVSSYTTQELRALKFRSVKEIDRAIGLLWSDSNLKGLPIASPDGITLIVPVESVRYFKANGLRVAISELLSEEDLPRERLAEMRRKYGM